MAVLLTGGTGKTSVRLAGLLKNAKVPFLLASRRVEAAALDGMPAVKFDWLDSTTFEKPFKYSFPNGEAISAIYLIAPEVPEPGPHMNEFIDYAVEKHHVRRFVLLAGNSVEKGGHFVGKVWQHLVDLDVEYCVIRATWFMERLSEQEHLPMIKNESKIYTACGDGKSPFVSAADIAAVAYRALIDETPHNCDYRVLGPELLTYDEVAAKLSRGLGRPIKHVKLSPDDNIERYVKSGFPEHYAKLLNWLETSTAEGLEERMNDNVQKVTGRPPMKLDEFIEYNKSVWQ